jgi:ferredoxin-thioredoxin reductase catalytic subunit
MVKKDKKQLDALKEQMKKYAESKGYKLNPNEKVLEGILNGLLRNKKFNGETYCPCRILTDNKEEDKKIICPCIYHPGEIELQGHCKCSLFFKK